MRIASYNVESLFDRPKIMNLADWAAGQSVLADYARVNTLFDKPSYSAQDKREIVQILGRLGLKRSDQSEFVTLRQNRGRLLKRSNGTIEVIVAGRDQWVGWLELNVDHVDATATDMTARVIKDVNADILGLVEAENRTALLHLNEAELVNGCCYEHVMLIDGNDKRGIDVGILTRDAYPIVSICSHVDDRADGSRIFSRDCAEYEVQPPSGERLWIMLNHLKSKGYGSQADSNARRKVQAERVRQIYDGHRQAGHALVAVMGDFNDVPASDALAPLLGDGSELLDISEHAAFDSGGRPGSYGNCTASEKIDYILLSPALFQRVNAGGVFRRGVWGGKNGTLFSHYPEITTREQAASDHAAMWADIQI